MESLFSKYLVCLECGGALSDRKNISECVRCGKKYKTKGHVFFIDNKLEDDIELSKRCWDEYYTKFQEQFLVEEKQMVEFQESVNKEIDLSKLNKKSVFLEIGCGSFLMGRMLAKNVKIVIGIDYSKNALKLAEELFRRQGITNYLLVQADIVHLPLKNRSIDFAYGGGVLEHIEEVRQCIGELSRVIKKGGICFNSVPIVNIGSLTYRQIWGNIPDIPILKHVYKFVHFKLLKTKLYFGYERSYRINSFKQWHYQAGFRYVEIKRLPLDPLLGFLPMFIRGFASRLAKNSILFWPMACFTATK